MVIETDHKKLLATIVCEKFENTIDKKFNSWG